MPELKCTVETCAHNKQCCCELNRISVDGKKAMASRDTCCNSFKDQSTSNQTSSQKSASLNADIACQATNCTYNTECVCHCTDVEVQGSNACSCMDTQCGSFKACV